MKLKQIIFKIRGRLIRLYWKLFKPFSIGVRALILNEKEQVLLVKHTYTDLWYLPGGGVNKNEHLLDALKREMYEELKLEIKEPPVLLGTYSNFYESKSDYVSIFVIKQFEMKPVQNLEIETWQFFDCDKIPPTTSRGSKKRIQEYLGTKDIDFIW